MLIVTRIYSTPNGDFAIHGAIPKDALSIRSGAKLYVTFSKGYFYSAERGDELLKKIADNKPLCEEKARQTLDLIKKCRHTKNINWTE